MQSAEFTKRVQLKAKSNIIVSTHGMNGLEYCTNRLIVPRLNVASLGDFGMVYNETDGLSVHNGVAVIWNADNDINALYIVDGLPEDVRKDLVAIQFNSGDISFLWKNFVPEGYEEGDGVVADGHNWNIVNSNVV